MLGSGVELEMCFAQLHPCWLARWSTEVWNGCRLVCGIDSMSVATHCAVSAAASKGMQRWGLVGMVSGRDGT